MNCFKVLKVKKKSDHRYLHLNCQIWWFSLFSYFTSDIILLLLLLLLIFRNQCQIYLTEYIELFIYEVISYIHTHTYNMKKIQGNNTKNIIVVNVLKWEVSVSFLFCALSYIIDPNMNKKLINLWILELITHFSNVLSIFLLLYCYMPYHI